MASWFEQLDLGSIQEQFAKSVEEASSLIGNVNNLDILNFDEMAIQEEEDLKREEEEEEEEDEDEEFVEEVIPDPPKFINTIVDHYDHNTTNYDSSGSHHRFENNASKSKIGGKSIVRKLNYTEDDDEVFPSDFDSLAFNAVKINTNIAANKPTKPNAKSPMSSAKLDVSPKQTNSESTFTNSFEQSPVTDHTAAEESTTHDITTHDEQQDSHQNHAQSQNDTDSNVTTNESETTTPFVSQSNNKYNKSHNKIKSHSTDHNNDHQSQATNSDSDSNSHHRFIDTNLEDSAQKPPPPLTLEPTQSTTKDTAPPVPKQGMSYMKEITNKFNNSRYKNTSDSIADTEQHEYILPDRSPVTPKMKPPAASIYNSNSNSREKA